MSPHACDARGCGSPVGRKLLCNVPVTAFFGGGPQWRPWSGRWLGVSTSGDAYCKLPMPFPKEGRIELVTEGARDGVKLSLGCQLPLWKMPTDPLLFRASYHQVRGQPTRPFSDHVVLDASGRGRFVGCSLLVRNPSRIWWGEGDEKVYVDGETFPSWFGTGTEDYFGYAWCDPTPFAAPLHAQVQCEGPDNRGFTQLHRTHILDSVPFQRSLRFEFERWHWVQDAAIDYESVAYWYATAGATTGLPQVPAYVDRRLEPLPPPKQLVVAGALEGEALRVLSCSGGTHEVQKLAFFEGKFSRDAHRWWRDGKVGDALELAVPVAETGRYRVKLGMTRADDFGQVPGLDGRTGTRPAVRWLCRPGGAERHVRRRHRRSQCGGSSGPWPSWEISPSRRPGWTVIGSASRPDRCPRIPAGPGGTIYEDCREVTTSASPERLFGVVSGVGGSRGWYVASELWMLRGMLDKLIGGVGMRRGRRDPDEVRVGDALDFFRVVSHEPPTLLRLRAEMKVPGDAWLEWRITESGGQTTLRQLARFHPQRIAGRLYWWALLPIHKVMFRLLAERLVEAAEGGGESRPRPSAGHVTG